MPAMCLLLPTRASAKCAVGLRPRPKFVEFITSQETTSVSGKLHLGAPDRTALWCVEHRSYGNGQSIGAKLTQQALTP
jgi:hypothetical protein